MEIGRYCDGRSVTYDEATARFAVGGTSAPVDAIRRYSLAGQIEWASPELQAWFDEAFPALAAGTRRPDVRSASRQKRFAIGSFVCGVVSISSLLGYLLVPVVGITTGIALWPRTDNTFGSFIACCCGPVGIFVAAPTAIVLGLGGRESERPRLALAGLVLGSASAAVTALLLMAVWALFALSELWVAFVYTVLGTPSLR